MKRFIKTTYQEVGEDPDIGIKTWWWLDTGRPIKEKPGYIAVQTYEGKDPNDFVKCDGMQILFTDQAEYYFVCKVCYNVYSNMQWSGSTKALSGWRNTAEKECKKHESEKGWCEFCDPVFG